MTIKLGVGGCDVYSAGNVFFVVDGMNGLFSCLLFAPMNAKKVRQTVSLCYIQVRQLFSFALSRG